MTKKTAKKARPRSVPYPPKETKSCRLTIRITPEQHAVFAKAAAAEGMTTSAWVIRLATLNARDQAALALD